LEATAIDLPVGKAEKAVPAYRTHVTTAGLPAERLVVSGQSYGGRVASLLVAEGDPPCAALVCFSYPLHRPGQPDWEVRTAHWPSITLPVLLLSGEADPFADLELLRRAVGERLPQARLVTYPRVGHGLKPVLDEALDATAAFVMGLGAR
jgi:predicted alpha/beta-hydrolase family hydrolase